VAAILYLAGRKRVAKAVADAAGDLGHTVISSSIRRLPRDLADRRPGAVIIDWESIRGKKPGVIRAIKSVGVPVAVVTSHLNAAFLSGISSVDVYLEKPCSVQELLACVSELIRAEQKSKSASPECSSANAAGRT
jgi:DNA-binding response OmpR family regulator